VGVINKRKGTVTGSDAKDGYATIQAQVRETRWLNEPFVK
jgi:hypothetical protein